MSRPVVYLEADEIVLIQARLIEDFGGTPGLRDFNLLASAAARPRNKALYQDADLLSQASSLLFGLAKAHAFIDGNQRIALQATYIFLRLNGLHLHGPHDDIASFLENGSDPAWTESVVDAFLRGHTR